MTQNTAAVAQPRGVAPGEVAASEAGAGDAAAAAIRLIFFNADPLPAASDARSLPRGRVQRASSIGEAVIAIDALRPDLVVVPYTVLAAGLAPLRPAPPGPVVAAGPVGGASRGERAAVRSALVTLRRHDRQLPVVVVVPAGKGAGEAMMDAIAAGATDVISESAQPECLQNKIILAAERRRLHKHPAVRIGEPAATERGRCGASDGFIIAACDAMVDVLCSVARSAAADCPVLIHGEPGTGKSLFAATLHRRGPRAADPPHVVDCGQHAADAVDHLLLEDCGGMIELRREHAGKTLIIENAGLMDARTQRRLLAVIQRHCNQGTNAAGSAVRFVLTASTAIDAARYRAAAGPGCGPEPKPVGLIAELYYELAGHAIHLPPLRSRDQDLAVLIDHFVRMLTGSEPVDETQPDQRISPEARHLLLAYDWPGNVTQLRSVVHCEVRWGEGTIVHSDRLSKLLRGATQASSFAIARSLQPQPRRAPARGAGSAQVLRLSELSSPQAWMASVDDYACDPSRLDNRQSLYGEAIGAVETGLIAAVLAKTDGNLAQSARLLGITRVSLRRKIHGLGLQIPGRKTAGGRD